MNKALESVVCVCVSIVLLPIAIFAALVAVVAECAVSLERIWRAR